MTSASIKRGTREDLGAPNGRRTAAGWQLAGMAVAALCWGPTTGCSDSAPGDGQTLPQTAQVCEADSRVICICPEGGSSERRCNAEGTQWSECLCGSNAQTSGDGGIANRFKKDPDAGVAETPDSRATTQPTPDSQPKRSESCDSVDEVRTPTVRKDRRGTVLVIERLDHVGQAFDATVETTFLDHGQDTSQRKQGVAVSANCEGFIGGTIEPSAKHCEYTKTACSSDGECADGVACRATDRLDAKSVTINGLVGGYATLERVEKGLFVAEGLTAAFSSGTVGSNIGPAKEDSFFPYNWTFWLLPIPKLIRPNTPDLDGSQRLQAGQEVLFSWQSHSYKSHEQDEVYIDIFGQQTNGGQQREIRLSCVVKDDGCHAVPPKAVDWLLAADGGWSAPAEFDVTVAHQYRHESEGQYYSPEGVQKVENTDIHAVLIKQTHGKLLAP